MEEIIEIGKLMEETIEDWSIDYLDLFDQEIDEYYRYQAKSDLLKRLKKRLTTKLK